MSETELQRMIVRILGDTTQYNVALSLAEKKTADVTNAITKQGTDIEAFTGRVNRLGGALTAALAGIGVSTSLYSAFTRFEESERILTRLTASIEASGRSATNAVPKYVEFAKSISATTMTGKDAVLNMIQQAESQGLSGEAAQRAAKNAVALAAARGMDAQSVIRMTVALEQGRAEMLGRFIPSLHGLATESEKTAKAQEVLGRMFQVATAEANTTAGRIDQMTKVIGGVSKDFGKFAAEFIRPVIGDLKSLAFGFASLDPSVRAFIITAAGLFLALKPLGWIISGIVIWFSPLVTGLKAVYAAGIAGAAGWIGWGAAISAAATGAYLLVKALADNLPGLKEWNEEADRARKLQATHVGRIKGETTGIVNRLEIGMEQEGGGKAIQDAMTQANRLVKDYEANVSAAKKQVAELDTTLNNAFGSKPLELAKRELKDAVELLDEARNRTDLLGKLWKKFMGGTESEESVTKLSGLMKSLREGLASGGAPGPQGEINKLRSEGMSEKQLKPALDLIDETTARDNLKAIGDFNTEIDTQTKLLDMNNIEGELYKQMLKGIPPALLNTTRAYLQQKEMVEDAKKALEAYSDRMQKLADEGAALTKQFATPQEKFSDEMDRLAKLLESEAIDFTTYQRAVKGAREELDKASKATEALVAIQGTAVGSAEALSHILAYQQGITPSTIPGAGLRPDLDLATKQILNAPEGQLSGMKETNRKQLETLQRIKDVLEKANKPDQPKIEIKVGAGIQGS